MIVLVVMNRRFFIVLLFLGITLTLSAQKETSVIDDKSAKTAIREGNFKEAIRQLNSLLKLYPQNYEYHALIGFAYLNSYIDYSQAIEHFQKALQDSKADPYLYYDLGHAYMLCYRMDEAIDAFRKFKVAVNHKEETDIPSDRMIEMCHNAKQLIPHRVFVLIQNLGENINTEYSDYNPFINENESELYYSSNCLKNPTLFYMNGYKTADIYQSVMLEDSWSIAKRIKSNLNTPYVEEIVGLSADGKEMFLNVNNLEAMDDIYQSNKKGRNYTASQRVDYPVSHPNTIENSAAISPDKKYLFFASDRESSKGKLDIFFSRRLPDGSWSMPVNAGDMINTVYNEAYPFLAPDGKTFYFAGEGHNSMGGYDIFKCYWNAENATFTQPENIGYPINTPGNNTTISVSKSGRYAYFSDFRDGGLGNLDIYKITFLDVPAPYYTVKGGLYVDETLSKPIKHRIKLTVRDLFHQKVGQFYTDDKDGSFILILKPGNYKVTLDFSESESKIVDLNIPDTEPKSSFLTRNWVIKEVDTQF